MKKYVFAAAAVMAFAGPSAAADLIASPVIVNDYVAPGHDWSGFYAGVMGGYGSGTTNFTAPGGVPAPVDVSTSGWILGGTVGVNGQWDMFVLGVEGDIAWSNIVGNTALAAPAGAVLSTNLGWIGTLRGRAGVAVDSALLYVTAGVAVAGVNSSVVGGGANTSFSGTHTGWTAGAGVEIAVTDDWSVKGEYSYTALGSVNDGGALAGGVPANAVNITPSFHAVKIGANFHF